MTSHILGIKDQVLVATITNKIGTSLFAKPEIKTVEELEGQNHRDRPAGRVLGRDWCATCCAANSILCRIKT